jgi:hypothetical protein
MGRVARRLDRSPQRCLIWRLATGQLSLGVGRRGANPDYGELTVVMRGNLALWSVWKATTARRVAAASLVLPPVPKMTFWPSRP